MQCYNEGHLVGDWYDAVYAVEVTTSALHGYPIPAETHEELWCMDIECMPVHREIDVVEAARWGELHEQVSAGQWQALCLWIESENIGDPEDVDVSTFTDRYCGEWEDWNEYVWSYVVGSGMQLGWPEEAVRYWNTEQFGRDLAYDYTVASNPDGGVYVYRDH